MMVFDHEKLEVYQISIRFSAWGWEVSRELTGHYEVTRVQFIRAYQSIAQNIAEGNGRSSPRDRKHFLGIARGSALECAAILDMLCACRKFQPARVNEGKGMLHSIVCMLTKLIYSKNIIRREES